MLKFPFANIESKNGLLEIFPFEEFVSDMIIEYKNMIIENVDNEDYDYVINAEKIHWSFPMQYSCSVEDFNLKETDPNFQKFIEEHQVSEEYFHHKKKYLLFGKKIKFLNATTPFPFKHTEKITIYGTAPYVVKDIENQKNN